MLILLCLMAQLHCQTWIRVLIRTRISDLIASLYYAEHVHIAYCLFLQESESESVCVSSNIIKPLVLRKA